MRSFTVNHCRSMRAELQAVPCIGFVDGRFRAVVYGAKICADHLLEVFGRHLCTRGGEFVRTLRKDPFVVKRVGVR